MNSVLRQPLAACAFGQLFRRVPNAAGCCYLTFDDGPHPQSTPAVWHALAAARVKSSFFVTGRLARAQVSLLRAARAAGHTIGNHGWQHAHPWTLTKARAYDELRD